MVKDSPFIRTFFMDTTFSQALNLNGMSLATSIVVWGMIIFLMALVLGIIVFFKKQLDIKKELGATTKILKSKKDKGFY